MNFDLAALLRGEAKKLHARGVEGGELFALSVIGVVCTGGFGYNLSQLLLYNEFYIYVRRGESYWAHWRLEPWTITWNALYSLFWFGGGLWCLGVVILYPIAILRWGPHKPAYKDKPPLSLDD